MNASLVEIYRGHKPDSKATYDFLQALEHNIASDLWKSAGGHWSEASIQKFREKAVQMWMQAQPSDDPASMQAAWIGVIRDFHKDRWGERNLPKKEVKPKTEEQKIFREMFTYVWVALQAFIITKTIALYFGINAALNQDPTGNIWMYLTMAVTVISLTWFAYSQTQKIKKREMQNRD